MNNKAHKTWGGDYDCLQDWPESTYLQCSDKGIVIGKGGNYTTAFFEAFPKNPSTFIRGEGATIADAELVAFNKYQKILSCPKHEYQQKKNSEHGVCVHCNLSTSNIFPPTHSCVVCGKEHVNYFNIKDEMLCQTHFMEQHEELMKGYDIADLKVYQGYESLYEKNKLVLDIYEFYRLSFKHNLVDYDIPEYTTFNLLDDQHSEFRQFVHNIFAEHYNKLNEGRSDDTFRVSIFNFGGFKDHCFMDKELNESLFKTFYKIEQVDLKPLLERHFMRMFERYRKANDEC